MELSGRSAMPANPARPRQFDSRFQPAAVRQPALAGDDSLAGLSRRQLNSRLQPPASASRLNPCELAIALFCAGARIADSCRLELDGRRISRTRAGLGSGLDLVLPGPLKDVWVNVPVLESFAQRSRFLLERRDSGYLLAEEPSLQEYPVRVPPEPVWYSQFTARGVPMHRIGVLQGTYLAIYISNSCGFWYHSPSLNCKFCTTGLNVGVNEVAEKHVEDVVEVAAAAKRLSGVTFVHFNSGYQSGCDLARAAGYLTAIKTRVGALVGLQLMPARDLALYDRLIGLGADHFSICYEFHNPEYFASLLPGKHPLLGQAAFFRALEYLAKKLPRGSCSGEIIAGIEPLDDTHRAIDYITSLGAFPTVCIFRPTVGSQMQAAPPPDPAAMHEVFAHVYEACRKNKIPLDLAPNIQVSLIVQPGDTIYLAPRTFASRRYLARQRLLRLLARPLFWWKRRRRSPRTAPPRPAQPRPESPK